VRGELLGELVLEISLSELLPLETRSCGRGPFGNTEEGKRPALKVVTKQWLVNLVCPVVISEVCRTVTA
jgi:hypothetical protein